MQKQEQILQWLKTKAWWRAANAYDFFPHGGAVITGTNFDNLVTFSFIWSHFLATVIFSCPEGRCVSGLIFIRIHLHVTIISSIIITFFYHIHFIVCHSFFLLLFSFFCVCAETSSSFCASGFCSQTSANPQKSMRKLTYHQTNHHWLFCNF